uniref:Uncharacterized protein n=1 Tax=Branchiostoma floridae TaxID=7739 RepID=C3ZBK3_BRAFL|eukprot:XP_002594229.1 hypothetical protein BRAFLDRAFT_65077 [Branchiostoma floridae]
MEPAPWSQLHGDPDHTEHGLFNIDTNTTLAEVQKLKEDHLRRPSPEMEHGHARSGLQQAAPTERAGGPRSTYCYKYQAKSVFTLAVIVKRNHRKHFKYEMEEKTE